MVAPGTNAEDGVRRKEQRMCLSCRCGEPHEDHGDPANITYEDLIEAAQAAGISEEQAADNIKASMANL